MFLDDVCGSQPEYPGGSDLVVKATWGGSFRKNSMKRMKELTSGRRKTMRARVKPDSQRISQNDQRQPLASTANPATIGASAGEAHAERPYRPMAKAVCEERIRPAVMHLVTSQLATSLLGSTYRQ